MRAYKNRRELQRLKQQGSAGQLFGANVIDSSFTSPTETSLITDIFSHNTEQMEAIANVTLESESR